MELTAKDTAEEIVDKFESNIDLLPNDAIQCALITVQYIINANPHSNPFNTDVYSTMDFWLEVKQELEKQWEITSK